MLRWATLLTCTICALAVHSLWADGIHLNGLSPRSLGRGGTNIAHADNGAIFFDNPAGAAFVSGDGLFDVGGNVLFMDFRYSDPDNPSASDFGITPLPSMGIVRKSEDEKFAYGIGIYAPAGFSESWEMQGQFPYGGEQTYKSFGSLIKIMPGVAYKVTERLSIGATFGMAISHEELEGPYYLQNTNLPFLNGVPTRIDLQATGATPIYSVGLQYKMTEVTTFGVTYQSESRFDLEGNTLVDIPVLGQARYDTHMKMAWPRTLGMGLRHELCPHRIISTDLVWYNWSAAFDSLGITLTDADRVLFPNISEELPLNWRDTISVKVGYEQILANGHTVRTGYVYHRNPIPAGTQTPYIQGIMEHAVSFGYGFKWRNWELDASYMFLWSPDVKVGTSDLLGGDFSNSSHQAFIHALGASAIYRY